MEKFACSLLGRVKPIDLLRKSAVALAALLLTAGLPASAQTAPNIAKNYEYQNRQNACFTHALSIFAGANYPGRLPGEVPGTIYRLIKPVASVTTGATVVGVTLPIESFKKVGQGVHIRVMGTQATNGNTKTLNLLFGTASIALVNNAGSNKDFYFDIFLYNTGTNASPGQQVDIVGWTNATLTNGLSTTTTQATNVTNILQIQMPTSTGAGDTILNEVTMSFDSD